jgi:dipeptidyl aminopeptidase/acylaminoacyl peptidase
MRSSLAVTLPIALSLLLLRGPAASVAQEPPVAGAAFTIEDVLAVRTPAIRDVSADGRWAVVTVASLRNSLGREDARFGDPTYVAPSTADILIIDTHSGATRVPFEEPRQARGFAWSPDGERLAFQLREGDVFRLVLWERAGGRLRRITLPRGRVLADAAPQWTADGARLLFRLQTAEWADSVRAAVRAQLTGPIVVESSDEPFLAWERIRRMGTRGIVAQLDVGTGRVAELLPETPLGDAHRTADGAVLVWQEDVTEKTDYTRISGRDFKVLARAAAGGEPRVLVENTRELALRWSGDGRSFVYGKDGALFAGTVEGGEPRRLLGPDSAAGAPPADSAARAARRAARFSPVRLSETGAWLIATNPDGFWLVETATGDTTRLLAAPQDEDDRTSPRYQVVGWSRDEQIVTLSYASRTAWERGFVRYDRRTGALEELPRDARLYGDARVAEDGASMVLTVAEPNRPPDVFVADAGFTDLRPLTALNPDLATKLARAELIRYRDVDGDELFGVLYYPLPYDSGTPVPTVFNVYEDFFDPRFNTTTNLLTAHGYAVVQPSVDLERGYPGEAWLKGVTAAANLLIERGIADPRRLGVHGTSYGGYATNLLITQTGRFAAAINISGKADMISFYTDSPRLGTRNVHAPERSQDRIGATLWEQPHKYIAHSAVMHADRITTPLLLITGREDHNVPERTTSEMYYALRRLGKRVEWVSYVHGGHGMPRTTEAEVRDYHERILGWYDRYLKAEETTGSDAPGRP